MPETWAARNCRQVGDARRGAGQARPRLAAKKKLRPGTVRSYAGHIRLYLTPRLGARLLPVHLRSRYI
jgi:hypothetical protein